MVVKKTIRRFWIGTPVQVEVDVGEPVVQDIPEGRSAPEPTAQAAAASAKDSAAKAGESADKADEAAKTAAGGGKPLEVGPADRIEGERDKKSRWRGVFQNKNRNSSILAVFLAALLGVGVGAWLFRPASEQGQSVSLSLENENSKAIDGIKARITGLEQTAKAAQSAAEEAKKMAAVARDETQKAVASVREEVAKGFKAMGDQLAALKAPPPASKPDNNKKKVSVQKKIPGVPLPPHKPKQLVRQPASATTVTPALPTSVAALPPSVGCPPDHPVMMEFAGKPACSN